MIFFNVLVGEWVYIVGCNFSIVDLSVVVYLFFYDYFGDVFWDLMLDLKVWYVWMKLWLSFCSLLEDWVGNVKFVKYYIDLDF